ncbi:hypothetical protein GCM10027280_18390 [Micromonospora polyrhachis]|nr:hypothetical protein [Micromonospora polyrhachis]
MLLRLAGRVPDELLTQARHWLAEGALAELARAVTFAVTKQHLDLHVDDFVLLGELLTDAGVGTAQLAGITQVDHDGLTPYVFQAVSPEVAAKIHQRGGTVPTSLDLTVDPAEPIDPLDQAAVSVVGDHPGVRGLWRAWRLPVDGSPWPPPRRVYVAEVTDPADCSALAVRLQHALAADGESAPQVETYPTGEVPPFYQRSACGSGALLWSYEPAPAIEHASAFDVVDPEVGATFAPDHARVTDPVAREAMLRYLDAGTVLMFTTALLDDVVDRSRGMVVPLNFRTDGRWIWNDAITYYLREHQLQPDPRLVEYAESIGYRMPTLDGVAVFRTLAKLQEPEESEPVWRYHGDEAESDD